jgi:hypothetical protein
VVVRELILTPGVLERMPPTRAPLISQLKVSAGFRTNAEGRRLYKTWRDAVKQEMSSRGILGKTDPGRAPWAELTRWALTKNPLSQKAVHYGKSSAAGREFTQAVDGLLMDVSKKLSFTRSQRVNLEPPQPPVQPTQG